MTFAKQYAFSGRLLQEEEDYVKLLYHAVLRVALY